MQVLHSPAHEIVVDQDLLDVFLQQSVDGVRPDQSGASDDNQFGSIQFHGNALPVCCLLSVDVRDVHRGELGTFVFAAIRRGGIALT
jgi:hypothetical protein